MAERRRARLSFAEWGALIEAALCLALVRAAILAVRFPSLSRHLGARMRESTHDDDEAKRPVLRRIRWAIGAVSRRAPWRCMCLEQAIAAKLMLRRRGIESTLYLGVARHEGETIQAHAWLRSGSVYVVGGETRSLYTIVSTFAGSAPG